MIFVGAADKMEMASMYEHPEPEWARVFPHMGVDALVLSLLSARLHGPEIICAARTTTLVSGEDLEDFGEFFSEWVEPIISRTWGYPVTVRYTDLIHIRGCVPLERAPHVGPGPEETFLYTTHKRRLPPLFSTLMVNSRDLLNLHLEVYGVVGNKLLEDMYDDADTYIAGMVKHLDPQDIQGYGYDIGSVMSRFMGGSHYPQTAHIVKYLLLRNRWYDALREKWPYMWRQHGYDGSGLCLHIKNCISELGAEKEMMLLPLLEGLPRWDLLHRLQEDSPNGPLMKHLFPDEVGRPLYSLGFV